MARGGTVLCASLSHSLFLSVCLIRLPLLFAAVHNDDDDDDLHGPVAAGRD